MSELVRGAVIDGRYVVEGLLARGGMAAVYLVRHQTLGAHHAVKVLELTRATVRQRLIQEGVAQSRLHHPNVVQVTDVIDVNGHPALVMEYVNGPSLAQLLQACRVDGKALPPALVDALAQGLFDGLEAAHHKGFVHRDLKPHNIMLGLGERGVIPKITDFGLVKLTGDDTGDVATRTEMVCGTPEYMAPEQARSAKHVDQRSDVFSLGVVLYELASGLRPFSGDDLFEIVERSSSGEYTPLREAAPHVPDRFVRAIDAALVPDRERRVGSVAELRAMWFADAELQTAVWDREWLLSLAVPMPAPAAAWEGTGLTLVGAASQQSSVADVRRVDPSGAFLTAGFLVSALLSLGVAGIGAAGLVSMAGLYAVRQAEVAASTDAAKADDPSAASPETVEPLPVPVGAVDPPVGSAAPPPPAPAPDAPDPAPVPAVVPRAPEVARPADAEVPSSDPSEPATATTVAPAPPIPVPAPAPPIVPPVVRVTGGRAFTVSLRDLSSGLTVPVGSAAIGRYEIVAFYEPNVPTKLTEVDLVSGSVVDVRCNSVQCAVVAR